MFILFLLIEVITLYLFITWIALVRGSLCIFIYLFIYLLMDYFLSEEVKGLFSVVSLYYFVFIN